ncbi:MAG: tRNA preQ1(34) S-adenosylmethionine ribosyltransferase-isomerase QueA [Gammaproteobacteria bacterium]
MNPADFRYELPEHLIAQQPLAERVASRLLCAGSSVGTHQEKHFGDLVDLLQAGDLLVLNNTRVLPGRLFGRKQTGGKVELLLERVLEDDCQGLVQLKSSKAPAADTKIEFEGGDCARVLGRDGHFFVLQFERSIAAVLQECGHVPLPPYIRRADEAADRERYQTVFAAVEGAVAAPTAGLHFDEALLDRLQERGVELAELTLHVGAGTFRPLQEEQLESGRLHAERITVSAETCAAIAATRQRNARVVAVGTTVVRALETAALEGKPAPFAGETELFIRPGFQFKVVDAMITNFHLPESSLLMLVCAFGGKQAVLDAYDLAVRQEFRFFSYGDAMFVERAV